jgi:hypothetical protein
MPAHAHASISQQCSEDNYDLLDINNRKYRSMSHAAQRDFLRARAFPETTMDRLTAREKLNATTFKNTQANGGNELQHDTDSQSGHQILTHNQGRDSLAHAINTFSRVNVDVEPSHAEVREVDAEGKILSRKRADLAVNFGDKTLIADITVVQTKNHNLTKNVIKEHTELTKAIDPGFRSVKTMLAPALKVIDSRMNDRANQKIKKYKFLFSNPDAEVQHYFFPVVISTDGTLHQSAKDFIQCVTSQDNLLQDESAADKIAVSLKSAILHHVSSRYMPKLRPLKAVNSYAIPVRGAAKERGAGDRK